MTLIKSSSKWAYYNEIDPFAAAWLRELIKDGLIAPGEVDERSIEDVLPIDVTPFRQVHWFSGIGVWSLALRQAGWSDDTPVWTGSCPCQPFSAAGKGGGFDDERHLWPAFHFLIEQCQPPVILGEQVAGRNGDAWLDLVSDDMEATGYAFGAIETVACGFGAPHKRSRNYWVAHASSRRRQSQPRERPASVCKMVACEAECGNMHSSHCASDGGMAHADGRNSCTERQQCGGEQRQQPENRGVVNMADADMWEREQFAWQGAGPGEAQGGRTFGQFARYGHNSYRPCPTNGYWRNADWLRCTDEKWRPVESSPLALANDGSIRDILASGGRASDAFTFPLAQKGEYRNRVGLLRGAGNAISIGQAVGFIEAVKGCL